MFGKKIFEPWIGRSYGRHEMNLLVLGESRYDEDYTDRSIIESLNRGDRSHTYTNFLQAALAKRYWEDGYDPLAFWDRVILYKCFPG